MRCDVKISYDSEAKTRELFIRRSRKTQNISITMDLIDHMKNPSKKATIRAQIEEKLRPLMEEKLGITSEEMKAILDEFLVNDID